MSKTKEGKKPELSPEEFLALPHWEEKNRICNYFRGVRDVDGKKQEKVFRVYIKDNKLVMEPAVKVCVPPDTLMSEKQVMHLIETKQLPTVSIEELFLAISEKIGDYVYADSIHITNAALKVMASYFLEVFHSVPYTDIYSPEYGSGKTTLMLVCIWLSYHGVPFTNTTGAVIYRIMKDVPITLGVDEVDNLFKRPNDNMDIIAIINSSNAKGPKIPRVSMVEKEGTVEYFDAFGPKYFTHVGSMPMSINSRSDAVPMIECRGRKDLKKYPSPEDFQSLRDQAYTLRWTHMDKVRETYERLIAEKTLKDRNGDIYLPILTIARLVNGEVFGEVLKYAGDQWLKNSLRSKDIKKEVLTRILWEGDFRNEVKVIDIAKAFNAELEKLELLGKGKDGELRKYTSQSVMKLLSQLRFSRAVKKSQGNVHFDINPKILEDNAHVYNIINDDSSEVSEVGELPKGVRENEVPLIPSRTSLNSPNSPALVLANLRAFIKARGNDEFTFKEACKHFQSVEEDRLKEIFDELLTLGRIFEPRRGKYKAVT